MKICIFTESVYRGGLDTFIGNLVSSWPFDEDSFVLVLNSEHPTKDYFAEKYTKNLTVETFDHNRQWSFDPQNQKNVLFLSKKILSWVLYYLFYYPYYTFSLLKYFRQCDFDALIVVNGGHPGSLLCRVSVIAWRLAKGKNFPSVYTIHNFPSYNLLPRWALSFVCVLDRIIDNPLSACATSIRTVSKRCFESFTPIQPIFQSGKFDYIYNGIRDPLLLREKKLDARIIKSQYCLMLASFEARKGYQYLFDAFVDVSKAMPELKLIICGSGTKTQVEGLNRMIASHHLERKVLIKGYVENPANLLLNASAVLVPSIEYESFGFTVIEAMAWSVPVVVTDSGGPAEIISVSGGGLVCSSNESGEFADAIVKILSDRKLAKTIGNKGRKYFENNFLAAEMSRKYCSLLRVD